TPRNPARGRGGRLGPERNPAPPPPVRPPPFPGDRPAPPRRDRRHAAAPRLELDRSILQERANDIDANAPQHPEVVGRSPTGLVDVVDRGVLEEARHRVEPHTPGRVHVAEADATTRAKGPPHFRGLHELLQAGNDTRVRSLEGGR